MTKPLRPTALKVLAIVERNPGKIVAQLMLHISGLAQPTVRAALRDLEAEGLIRRVPRLDGHQAIFAATDQAQAPLPGPTKNIWADYVPPKPIVTRPDAFDHEHQAMSRRGDALVLHAKPLGMCVGRLPDHISHQAAKLPKAAACKKPAEPVRAAPVADGKNPDNNRMPPRKKPPKQPLSAPNRRNKQPWVPA